MDKEQTLRNQLAKCKLDRRAKERIVKQLENKARLENTLKSLTIEKQVLENASSLRSLSVRLKKNEFFGENLTLKEKLSKLEGVKHANCRTLVEVLKSIKAQLVSEQHSEISKQEVTISELKVELSSTRRVIEKIRSDISNRETSINIETEEPKKCKCL